MPQRPDVVAATGSLTTTPGGLPAATQLDSRVWALKIDEFTDWFTDDPTRLFFYSSRWAGVWRCLLIATHCVIYSQGCNFGHPFLFLDLY